MKPTIGRALLAAFVLVAAPIACIGQGDTSTTAPPAATPEVQAAPTNPAEPTTPPEPTATTDPCISWDQVTPAMKDDVVCMRGLITEFDRPGGAGTRYSFSDKSHTFFLYSAKYEITNPNTGKTIAPGTCVEVTGRIDVQSDTPFINLDRLIDESGGTLEGFIFYDDASACG